MNQRNKLILGSIIGLGVVASASAFALSSFNNAQAETNGPGTRMGPNYSPERHAQMEEAFNNNNYAQWKELQGNRGQVSQVVNEQNFARFAEAHRLMIQGKTEEATKIRAELGLKNQAGGRIRDGGCNCANQK